MTSNSQAMYPVLGVVTDHETLRKLLSERADQLIS